MDTKQLKKLAIDQPRVNRFSFFSSKTRQAIGSSTWDGLFPSGNLDQIFQAKHKSRPDPNEPIWWIDICDATEQDVDTVSEALSIHPLTAEDIAIREPREKVDVYKNYYLISFQTLVEDKTKGERPGIPASAALYILVFQYGVVTFSPSGCGHVARARERICKMHDPTVLTSDWVCYAMMYVQPNSCLSTSLQQMYANQSIETTSSIASSHLSGKRNVSPRQLRTKSLSVVSTTLKLLFRRSMFSARKSLT
jgi:Mg2+ and Co2+ transporter CorA